MSRSPSSAPLPFSGEGSPTKGRVPLLRWTTEKRIGTLILSSKSGGPSCVAGQRKADVRETPSPSFCAGFAGLLAAPCLFVGGGWCFDKARPSGVSMSQIKNGRILEPSQHKESNTGLVQTRGNGVFRGENSGELWFLGSGEVFLDMRPTKHPSKTRRDNLPCPSH